MKRSSNIALAAAGISLLTTTTAAAETQEAEFSPTAMVTPREFPFDQSQEIPLVADVALDVGFSARAYQDLYVSMPGRAVYDFEFGELSFEAESDAGAFENTLGFEFDITVTAPVIGEIPIDLVDITREANTTFAPYVLAGAAERPVTVEERFEGTLVEAPSFNLADITFDLVDLEVTLVLEFEIDVPGATFSASEIVVADEDGNELGVYDQAGEAIELALPNEVPGESSTVYATLSGEFNSAMTLTVIGTVLTGAAPNQGTLISVPFEVVEIPVAEDLEHAFDPIALTFDVPEEPEVSVGDGGDDDSGGDDGGGESDSGAEVDDEPDRGGDSGGGTGSTGAEPEFPVGDTDDVGDTDGMGAIDPGLGVGEEVDGCGCTASSRPAGLAWTFVPLFGLVALRRRRWI